MAGPIPHCPCCRVELEEEIIRDRLYYHCPYCDGSLLTLGTLRARCGAEPARVTVIWQMACATAGSQGYACPLCGDAMKRVFVPLTETGAGMELDVCVKSSCQVIWFDAGELAELPASTDPAQIPADAALPQAAREIMAIHEVEQIRRRHEQRERIKFLSNWITRSCAPRYSFAPRYSLVEAITRFLLGDDD